VSKIGPPERELVNKDDDLPGPQAGSTGQQASTQDKSMV
jgi:hypothetical protein